MKHFVGIGFFFGMIFLVSSLLTAEEMRDPLVPLITEDGKRVPTDLSEPAPSAPRVDLLSGLTLQGIVFDPNGNSYAILNGKLVQEKEDIDGVRVKKIEPNKVTVIVDQKEHGMFLHELTEESEVSP